MLSRPPIDRIAFLGISWYSILIVSAIILGVYLASREEKRIGLPQDTALDFSIYAIPLALICGRIYYVIFQWDYYAEDLISIFDLRGGGMAIFGAVIGGIIAAYIVSKKKKISILTILDIVVPSLVLGQAIGRWGNYLNMEAYGFRLAEEYLQFFPFAVEIPVGSAWYWHMATFFYESMWDIAVFVALYIIKTRTVKKGDTFMWYLLLYCAGRTIIEGLRDDSLTFYNEFVRISQIFSAIACLTVVILFFIRRKDKIRPLFITSLSASVVSFALCFIGEFERGAYGGLFQIAQVMLAVVAVLAAACLILALVTHTNKRCIIAQGILLVCSACVLLAGLGRSNSDNTLYVSFRQIVCMLSMITCGLTLYPFEKQTTLTTEK